MTIVKSLGRLPEMFLPAVRGVDGTARITDALDDVPGIPVCDSGLKPAHDSARTAGCKHPQGRCGGHLNSERATQASGSGRIDSVVSAV